MFLWFIAASTGLLFSCNGALSALKQAGASLCGTTRLSWNTNIATGVCVISPRSGLRLYFNTFCKCYTDTNRDRGNESVRERDGEKDIRKRKER